MRWKKKKSVALIYFHNLSLFDGILLIKSLVSNKPDWVLEPLMTNNTLNEWVLSFGKNNRMIFRDSQNISTQELNWIGDPSKMFGSASSLKISLDSFSSPYGPPWKISPDQAHNAKNHALQLVASFLKDPRLSSSSSPVSSTLKFYSSAALINSQPGSQTSTAFYSEYPNPAMGATHQSNLILGPFPQTFAQVVKTASSSSTHHLLGPLVSHFSSSAPTSGKERAQATVQLLRAARLK